MGMAMNDGNSDTTVKTCDPPADFALRDGDCDDADPISITIPIYFFFMYRSVIVPVCISAPKPKVSDNVGWG